MIGKMFGRGDGQSPKRKKDKAIVHQSVPEEVLFPQGRQTSEADTSWMNDVFSKETPTPPTTPPAAPKPTPRKAAAPRLAEPATAASPSPAAPIDFPDGAPNARTSDRPRFPVGWLVAIEGSLTGEWFPLERGVSTVGGDPAATIPVNGGAAAIAFDESQNTFALSQSDGATVRLNGVAVNGAARLRDGDVIGFDGVALKLVALCNGNFRWSDLDRAVK